MRQLSLLSSIEILLCHELSETFVFCNYCEFSVQQMGSESFNSLNDCQPFLLVCRVVALSSHQLPAVERCRSGSISGWSLAYPSAGSCRGCIGKKPYHVWLIIVDRPEDFVLICSSLASFKG